MNSLAGHFLVAAPQLQDPNFFRTVVLMLQHEQAGALGVVVNRPGSKTIRTIWEMIDAEPCDCEQLVYVGGPVPGPLIALHNNAQLAEREIIPGLFMSMQRDAIDALVRRPSERFRLFSGNAGWSGGQLEGELRLGGWLTTQARTDEALGDYETLWNSVCNRIGREVAAPHLPLEQLPRHPEDN